MAAGTQKERHDSRRVFLFAKDGQNRYSQVCAIFSRRTLPAIWSAARLRRSSVFTAGENLGAGGIHYAAVGGFAALRMRRTPCGHFRRAFESPESGGRLRRPEPKKKDMTYGRVFLFGAGDRTRTGTLSPAVDFESTTSTNSITPAGTGHIIQETLPICKNKIPRSLV